MFGYFKKQPSLIWLLVVFSWFVSLGRAVLPTHLVSEGLTLNQILFGSFLIIIAQVAVLFFLGFLKITYRASFMWTAGIVLYSLFFILSGFHIDSYWQYYLGSLFAGIASVLFYLFFNIAYFSATSSDKLYSSSAKFFNILGITSIVVPIIAGLLAALNFSFAIFFSLAFFIASLLVVSRQKEFVYSFSLGESLNKAYGAKKIIFLNGTYDALNWGIVSIFTLTLITSPLGFGSFFSYLAIVAVISNALLSSVAERYKKGYLVAAGASLCVAGAVTFIGLSVESIVWWALSNSILQFVSPLFNSSVLALSLESAEDKISMLPAREVLLNLGRLLGLSAACFLFYFHFPLWYIFIIPAIAALLLGFLASNPQGRIHS